MYFCFIYYDNKLVYEDFHTYFRLVFIVIYSHK